MRSTKWFTTDKKQKKAKMKKSALSPITLQLCTVDFLQNAGSSRQNNLTKTNYPIWWLLMLSGWVSISIFEELFS